jgi:hypothetical protein
MEPANFRVGKASPFISTDEDAGDVRLRAVGASAVSLGSGASFIAYSISITHCVADRCESRVPPPHVTAGAAAGQMKQLPASSQAAMQRQWFCCRIACQTAS